MRTSDHRPFGQKVALRLIKSPLGLKLSAQGRKKAAHKQLDNAVNETVLIPRQDGTGEVRIRVYKPANAKGPLPIVVFFHGGGYATGWPERHHAFYHRLMASRPCIIVAPAFRLSIEAPYPAGHDDCYDTLLWVRDNAEQLGGNADNLILAGNSSGGGLVLSTALRARDSGDIKIAFIMPFYPMIDDRASNWTKLPRNKITWTREHGVLAWHLLLRELRSRKRYDIPAYAVPALAEDVSGLPPALGYVGDLDILRAEAELMADRMKQAGCRVTFRTFDGVFHAMEDSAPQTPQAREVHLWVSTEFARMVDSYCSV
ncbi:alpha/beta hydrolase [Ruegeria lacuscaerulensis]|uniref:alpha/beta hydrolase n=1 Tax=Ruegeria lacuscaerulensis TaxID=55218 RepID=UPI00147FEC9C|nr:alpha/beta hydrolase [Ruegeria lacuscaerulensis]